MKTKKKVAPKRERDSHKKDLADLAYWKSVAAVLNAGRKNEQFATFTVSGWTYRDRASFNRIVEVERDGKVIKDFYDSGAIVIPGYLAEVILNLGKYQKACLDVEEIISQFGW